MRPLTSAALADQRVSADGQDGVGEDAKLTIKFEAGTKTLLAKFVTEVP